MLVDEGADLLDRLLGLGHISGVGLPDMPHAIPDFQCRVDAGLACTLRQADRVAQEDFTIANLNEQRRQAAQIGIDGRNERLDWIVAGDIQAGMQ